MRKKVILNTRGNSVGNKIDIPYKVGWVNETTKMDWFLIVT